MITTATSLTQPVVYTIPVGPATGYTTARLALYVTQGGKTTRYTANSFQDCSATGTGHITVNANVVALPSVGSYRLEFRYESLDDIDPSGMYTIPIASNIVRRVEDANSTTIKI